MLSKVPGQYIYLYVRFYCTKIITIFALKSASGADETRKPAKRYRFNSDPNAKFFNCASPRRPCQLNKFRNNFTAIANCR